jgi:hypothetical protein
VRDKKRLKAVAALPCQLCFKELVIVIKRYMEKAAASKQATNLQLHCAKSAILRLTKEKT